MISFTYAAKEGAHVYGYSTTDNLSWRVDLYVSGREDGTLDPSVDTVQASTATEAKHIGSLLYTQENFDTTTAYIQA